MKKLILSLLLVLPLTVNAGVLGFDSKVDGDYNTNTGASTLTAQVGKTMGLYGLSVTGDIDFDLEELEYTGMDFKAEYDFLEMDNVSIHVSSGLDTNWAMEDIVVGFTLQF